MKKIAIHFVLFLLYQQCFATYDSLPACIKARKLSDKNLVTEYEYKGQRWFVFTETLQPKENNTSDNIYITKFFDASCRLVCTWTKGGIAGLNKVTPDTIEKANIKKVETDKKDTSRKSNTISIALPDTIVKLALAKNIREIHEYFYKDKILYTFLYPLHHQLPRDTHYVDNPYYDETGKVILMYVSARQSMFSRGERWEPSSVKRSDVTKVKNGVWLRQKNNYINNLRQVKPQ